MSKLKIKTSMPKEWIGKNYFLNNLSFTLLMQLDDAQVNIAIVQNKNEPAGFVVELNRKSFLILRENKLI
ncbi:MAG: hypothetical protein FD122_2670 [Stygiobacter sp.]|nr:MAG: hypothetical protein FD122_2670 [Stygiobacter sp.]KAF0215205.1 MAG: hypothetical protein FD178_1844 [Ignavibacteria bacterium]